MMRDIAREYLRPTLIIVAVAFLCVMLLSQVQSLTAPKIAAGALAKQRLSLSLVLPGYETGPARTARVDGQTITWWEGEKRDDTTLLRGYAFITTAPGYGGDIESMVGVDGTGAILGLSILRQSETPGLGDRCVEVALRETLWDHLRGGVPVRDLPDEPQIPWFQNQFKGVNAGAPISIVRRGVWDPSMREGLLAANAVSALTGATITTDAVVKSVEQGMALLMKARAAAEDAEVKQ